MRYQIRDAKDVISRVVQTQKTKPMIPYPFPELLWQKVGMDLFEWRKLAYLVILDYYSIVIEIAQLYSTISKAVTLHCKNIFLRHRIPEEVVTYN